MTKMAGVTQALISQYVPAFQALKKRKPSNTPPICFAVRLPFVRLGVGVTGKVKDKRLQNEERHELGHLQL